MKKTPVRRCVGCGEGKPKKELVRVVKSPEGDISLDGGGRKPGRGAYVCRDTACLAKAQKRKALERAFKAPVPPDVYDRLAAEMPEVPPDDG